MKSRISHQALRGTSAGRARRRALGPSKVRFRRLFETAQDGILILDGTTHKIIESNPFITELFGCSKVHLIGKELSEIGILTDQRAAHETFEKMQAVGCVRF